MSILVDAINNGYVDLDYGNKKIGATYSLGDGNHQITVEGDECSVLTTDGNCEITIDGNYNKLSTGDGNNNINYTGQGGKISTGNGNNSLVAECDDSVIETGSGNDDAVVEGYGNIVDLGDGDNNATVLGNSNIIKALNGNDFLLMLGKRNTANLGNGNNNVIFYGNNTKIKTGNGNDTIMTYDQVKDNPQYASYVDKMEENLNKSKAVVNVLTSKEVIKRTKKSHKLKKSTVRTTYLYKGYIDTYNQTKVGVKNAQITTGGGSDSVAITTGKGTQVTDASSKDKVKTKSAYVYSQQYVGRQDYQFTKTTTTHEGRGSYLSGGTIGGVIGRIVGTVVRPVYGTIAGAAIGKNAGHKYF